MELVKRMISILLYMVVLSVLLVGSCAGPGVLYVKSPHWFLQTISPDEVAKKTFFVAFMTQKKSQEPMLEVVKVGAGVERNYPDANYHLAAGQHGYNFGGGSYANITVEGVANGEQRVRVFVSGDTPWSSLSEYRVKDNTLTSLRHAHSVGWFLLGSLVLPWVVLAFRQRLRRRCYRMLGIEMTDTSKGVPVDDRRVS